MPRIEADRSACRVSREKAEARCRIVKPQRRRQGELRNLMPARGDLVGAPLRPAPPAARSRTAGCPPPPPPGSAAPGPARAASISATRSDTALSASPVRARWRAPAVSSAAVEPIQVRRSARGGTQAPDDRDREVGQAPAQRAHRQQAGRIGPLQVVHADHQRLGQGQLLGQVAKASTTRNRSPGSLVTVIGRCSPGARRPAARRWPPAADQRKTGRIQRRRQPGRTAGYAPAPRPAPQRPACRGCAAWCQRLVQQPGLTDPRLPLDQHHGQTARRRPVQTSPRTRASAARPRMPGTGGRVAMTRDATPVGRQQLGTASPRPGHHPSAGPEPGTPVTSYNARSSPSQPVNRISSSSSSSGQ